MHSQMFKSKDQVNMTMTRLLNVLTFCFLGIREHEKETKTNHCDLLNQSGL